MVGETKRILFVSPGPDMAAPASGEGTRLKHLSEEFDQLGWDIYTLVPRATTSKISCAKETYVYEQWSVPHLTDLNPSFITKLSNILYRKEFDILHLSKGVCTAAFFSQILSEETIVSYAAQNLEADHARDFVDPELPIYKRLLGPQLIPLIERLTVACADTVTTVSKDSRDAFLDTYRINKKRIEYIPTGTQSVDQAELIDRVEICSKYDLDPDRPIAIFHGTYSHPPNKEAFDLIADEIICGLREQGRSVQFLLVGEGVPEYSVSNIVTTGFVEDLYSVLNAADFAVVPIRHGGGTKTKIYDYISTGLPLIATKKSVEGIGIENGQHGVITKEVGPEFTSAISTIAQEEETRQEYRENLQQLRQNRTWSQSAAKLDAFYGEHIKGEDI